MMQRSRHATSIRWLSIVALFAVGGAHGGLYPQSTKLTAEQRREVDRLQAAAQRNSGPGNHGLRYDLKGFRVVKKLPGGYVITAAEGADPFFVNLGLLFLETKQDIPENAILATTVYFSGDFRYEETKGTAQNIRRVKIPVGFPISTPPKENR